MGETGSHTWFSSKGTLSSLAHGRNTLRNIQTPILPLLLTQLPKHSGTETTTICPFSPKHLPPGLADAHWVPTAPIGPASLLTPGTDIMAHVGQTTGSLPWAGVGLGLTLLGWSVGRHGSLPHHAAPLATLAHHGNGRLALIMLAPALCGVVVGRGCLLVHHGDCVTGQRPQNKPEKALGCMGVGGLCPLQT